MLKSVGAKYTLVGHSDNRSEGDTNLILRDKVNFAVNNNLKVVFCIGENKIEKKTKKTLNVLKKQLTKVLNKKFNKNNILVAYEPIWSIGTGKIPKIDELEQTVEFIKKKFKGKLPKILYGGSVNSENIRNLKKITNLDGFLIGGASQNSKKFIDIVKKTYN